jgi:hypothetical protein
VIAVLLLVVGVAIDLALGVQLRRDVHDRRTAPPALRPERRSRRPGTPPDTAPNLILS